MSVVDPAWLAAHPDARKKRPSLKGYPDTPGTGPFGETCGSCAHHAKVFRANVYHKCLLIRHAWTGGPGTDIRLKSPACSLWQKK